MPALDIRGCSDDSPTFRKRIQSHEESIHNFESSLKSLIKLTRSQVDLSTSKIAFLFVNYKYSSLHSFHLAYSQQQNELAREFLSFAQAQDDPIVGK